MSCIYGLSHGNEIRYVGQTKQSLDKRLRSHLGAARRGAQHWSARWIRSTGYAVEIVVLEHDPVGGLDEAERAWIALLRDMGCRLTNLTDGGEGVRGLAHRPRSEEHCANLSAALKGRSLSPETRAKISRARRGQKYGPLSEKHRAKISAALVGRKASPETRARMGNARRGKPLSKEHCAKLSAVHAARRKLRAEASSAAN